jgi:hypothetical protein
MQWTSWPWSYAIKYLCYQWLLWVRISIRARGITCDKVCQSLATGWLFSHGPPGNRSLDNLNTNISSKNVSRVKGEVYFLASCIFHISIVIYQPLPHIMWSHIHFTPRPIRSGVRVTRSIVLYVCLVVSLWGFYARRPCSGIADKYFFFLLGLCLLFISRVGVGGLSPISVSGG